MKIKHLVILSTLVLSSLTIQAREIQGLPTVGNRSQVKDKSASCSASTGGADLDINNVRAKIWSAGDMWWDLQNNAYYQVPKESIPKKNSLFAGALWIGGLDEGNRLHIAAQTYRQSGGQDFFPGPLRSDNGSADPALCADATSGGYDKVWKINRQEVINFVLDGGPLTENIARWPGSMNKPGFAPVLAPFADENGNNIYEPDLGEYPFYPIKGEPLLKNACDGCEEKYLNGDQTLWWVFNDKADIHAESQGEQIGLEIRAQAFAFATNDELNNMTFYKYDVYNRSTTSLKQTYMGVWTDADLGNAFDDYVGCDVSKGLGFIYNGDSEDEGPSGYGFNPPACGVDFFQGPYKDNDNIDNTSNPLIEPEAANGTGYGDACVDNERMGMARFTYFNNDFTPTGNPQNAQDYYNYLKGLWKDNQPITYGGSGRGGSINARYMFPEDSDPLGIGTGGVPQAPWSEVSAGNTPADRRFVQSAGPFTLAPGAKNSVTMGVVWARATSGGARGSVALLKQADKKAQDLFNNCFQPIEGPDAPEVEIVELDRQIVINLKNTDTIVNWQRGYKFSLKRPNGLEVDSTVGFGFEGFLVYQLRSQDVTLDKLNDPDAASLVAQCDIKNGVAQIVNKYYDPIVAANVPREEVNGENKGLRLSFPITDDRFAAGTTRLTNHKVYYYVVLAYAKGNNDSPDFLTPFLASRKSLGKANIQVYKVIPHIPQPEDNGLALNSGYNTGPKITRVQGQGNGGNILELTPETEALILKNGYVENPEYQNGRGPVDIKVVNPLKVPKGKFTLKLNPENLGTVNAANNPNYWKLPNTAKWELMYEDGTTISSDRNIDTEGNYEQLLTNWGLSIDVKQVPHIGGFAGQTVDEAYPQNGILTSSIEYTNPSNKWLGFGFDLDAFSGPYAGSFNWIKAGGKATETFLADNDYYTAQNQTNPDPQGLYEKVLVQEFTDPVGNTFSGGTWAPYALASHEIDGPALNSNHLELASMSRLASVDIVLTADKSKWTRCPVFETTDDLNQGYTQGSTPKFDLRKGSSRNVDGGDDQSDDRKMGMGYFPGYAINLETGERLNMAFGESSMETAENGRDMVFNPTVEYNINNSGIHMAGKHFIYVFGTANTVSSNDVRMPHYDEGKTLWDAFTTYAPTDYKTIGNNPNPGAVTISHKKAKEWAMAYAMWTAIPLQQAGTKWLEGDVRIKLRVAKPYKRFNTEVPSDTVNVASINNRNPIYTFNTSDIFADKNNNTAAKDALDIINIVPNPYYAYSYYENGQADNRVKITNLPAKCNVTIYTANGQLVRRFKRDEPKPSGSYKDQILTSLEWDLKNTAKVPVASGMYIVHIEVPEVGEKVLKFMCVARPTDLDGF